MNKAISRDDVNDIVRKYFEFKNNVKVQNFTIANASDKMLGFLSDYWKLKVDVVRDGNESKNKLCFFIKAICIFNDTKASIVRESNFYKKELSYYEINNIMIKMINLRPWCPKMVTKLHEALVFEDLEQKKFKNLKNKSDNFDKDHTLVALEALSRFHASSIIYEELKSIEQNRPYRLIEDQPLFLDDLGYVSSCQWFNQCMDGALEAYKAYSKHSNNHEVLNRIASKWTEIWYSALNIGDDEERKVICHRDLWNNNIMFHYDNEDKPNDCVLLDFQAAKYHCLILDVLMMLYVNLDNEFRENNMNRLLNYYHRQFSDNLAIFNIDVENIIPINKFLARAEEYKLWGLITSACLIPQVTAGDCLDDIDGDSQRFNDILLKDKGGFIKKVMAEDDTYKKRVLTVFDEIAEKYCLNDYK